MYNIKLYSIRSKAWWSDHFMGPFKGRGSEVEEDDGAITDNVDIHVGLLQIFYSNTRSNTGCQVSNFFI